MGTNKENGIRELIKRAPELIEASLKQLLAERQFLEGFAGAAPGVEIIFHEICNKLGIQTTICLPIPANNYAPKMFGKLDDWRGRFLALKESKDRGEGAMLELSQQADLPDWLYGVDANAWERGSRWLLKMAEARSAGNVTLLTVDNGVSKDDDKVDSLERLAREGGRVRIVPLPI